MIDDKRRAEIVDALSEQYTDAVQEAAMMLIQRGHDPRKITHTEQEKAGQYVTVLWSDGQLAATVTCDLNSVGDTMHVGIEIMLVPVLDDSERGKAN